MLMETLSPSSLRGGGTGKVYGVGNTFDSIVLSGTTASSSLTITVKKQVAGDGQATILNISSDGLVKKVWGTTVNLTGQMLLNTLKQPAGKAAASIALRQISGAEIRVQGLPGVVNCSKRRCLVGSRIISTDPIKKFSAASLLDSDILVGGVPRVSQGVLPPMQATLRIRQRTLGA